MRGLRRRSGRPASAGAAIKTAPVPVPGRYTDQLLQCETCGRPFVFTVEEQRQLADLGQGMEAPTQCPRCAPRQKPQEARQETRQETRLKTEDLGLKSEDPRPRANVERSAAFREPSFAPRHTAPVARYSAPVITPEIEEEDEDIRFTVRQFGHVKVWDSQKGQGVIVDDDSHEEYPVYLSGLDGGLRHLALGQAVEFELNTSPRRREAVFVITI